MNLSELQKMVFDQIDENQPNRDLYKTKDIHKRLNVYHRGMKSRIKQALLADFEESIPHLKEFEELFESFFKTINSYHFSLSEYYSVWNEWVKQQSTIKEPIKALTRLECLQQESYFKAYNLFATFRSFQLNGHQVIVESSLIVESFDWDVNEDLSKKNCKMAIWTIQSTVYTEPISNEEFVVLSALIEGKSLEQSLSPVENIYKNDELLSWLETFMKKWTLNNWLSLSES